jgi:hypothetical protein
MNRTLIVVCALAVAPLAAAGQASKVDVTGKWLFNVQTDAGSGTPTVTLKQDGEKLTGHYSSQNFGEQELTGTVKATRSSFRSAPTHRGRSSPSRTPAR